MTRSLIRYKHWLYWHVKYYFFQHVQARLYFWIVGLNSATFSGGILLSKDNIMDSSDWIALLKGSNLALSGRFIPRGSYFWPVIVPPFKTAGFYLRRVIFRFLGGIAHPLKWLCCSFNIQQWVSEPLYTMFPLEDLDENWTGYVSWVYLVTPWGARS